MGKSRSYIFTFFNGSCAAELCQKVIVVTNHTLTVWQKTWSLETDSCFQEFHVKKGADSITSKLWLALHTTLPITICFQLHKAKWGEKNSLLGLFHGFLRFKLKKKCFSLPKSVSTLMFCFHCLIWGLAEVSSETIFSICQKKWKKAYFSKHIFFISFLWD